MWTNTRPVIAPSTCTTPRRDNDSARMEERSMPLIKPRTNRVKTVRHICRLQEPNRDALVLYARFIGDTADYVLNQLIDTTIAKHREFVAWRAEHPTEAAVQSFERRPTAVPQPSAAALR